MLVLVAIPTLGLLCFWFEAARPCRRARKLGLLDEGSDVDNNWSQISIHEVARIVDKKLWPRCSGGPPSTRLGRSCVADAKARTTRMAAAKMALAVFRSGVWAAEGQDRRMISGFLAVVTGSKTLDPRPGGDTRGGGNRVLHGREAWVGPV